MRRLALAVFATLFLSAPFAALAAATALSPDMQPLSFLVGHWTAVDGKAENNALDRGVSNIEPAAGGSALLRRDRTDLLNQDGTPRTSFEQVMLIYPESGAIHADYFDGTHVIHYTSAVIDPGKSVTFNTAAIPGPPHFRLTYAAKGADRLTVKFEMQPPGAPVFRTIAEGEAKREP